MAGIAPVLIEDTKVTTLPTTPEPQPIVAEEVERALSLLECSSAGTYSKSQIRDAILALAAASAQEKERSSSLTDTLLGTVLDLEQAHHAVAKQADTITQYRHELRIAEQDVERIRKQAIEAERTVLALTKLEPEAYANAANAFETLKVVATDMAMKIPGFAELLAANGAATPGEIDEMARRFREQQIVVERANAGYPVPR